MQYFGKICMYLKYTPLKFVDVPGDTSALFGTSLRSVGYSE